MSIVKENIAGICVYGYSSIEDAQKSADLYNEDKRSGEGTFKPVSFRNTFLITDGHSWCDNNGEFNQYLHGSEGQNPKGHELRMALEKEVENVPFPSIQEDGLIFARGEDIKMEGFDHERQRWCEVKSIDYRDDSVNLSTGAASFCRNFSETKIRIKLDDK